MKKAFTLVELLVVIAIVGLLTVISTAAILSARQKRQARVVAEEIQNILMAAHTYALSPSTSTTSGDKVEIYVDNSTHFIEAKVSGGTIVKTRQFSSSVTLKCMNSESPPANTSDKPCFSFEIASSAGSNNIGQVTVRPNYFIQTTSAGKTYNIKVKPLSGVVTVEAI